MKLTQILAIALLISSVYSESPEWVQTTEASYKKADGSALTEGELARKFWIYSNSAYCAERKVDAQTCNPCKFTQPREEGQALETAESWTHNGAIVYVYYDKTINKVVVTFRGTEGLMANNNWRTNLDLVSTVTQCKSSGQTIEAVKGHRLHKKHNKNKDLFEDLKSVVAATYHKTAAATKALAQGAKTATVAVAQGSEHALQLIAGTPIQYARQTVGNTYYKFTGDNYKCYVHHGFWGNTHGLMHGDTVRNYISKLYKEKSADGIAFTGHSLGGAMATIAAASFLQKQIEDDDAGKTVELKVASLYTYGSPQVGDGNFQAWFDKETQAFKISNLRFVYNNDAVTKSMGYKHVGKLIRYSTDDNRYTNCGQKSTDKDMFGDDNVDCSKGYLLLQPKQSIKDHGLYFSAEVLTEEGDKCDMRVDQEVTDDAAYQLEKQAKINALLKEKLTAKIIIPKKTLRHRLSRKHRKVQKNY